MPVSKTKKEQIAVYRKAERVLDKHGQRLRDRKGVIGCSIGYREVDGKRTSELCIKIHVEKKIEREKLRANQLLPKTIDGVPVDVVERRKYVPLRTVQGGMFIAAEHSPSERGTLGLVTYTPVNKEPRLLTNAHVVMGDKDIDEITADDQVVLRQSSSKPVIGNAMPSKLFLTSLTDCALVRPAEGVNPMPGIPGITGPLSPGELTLEDVIFETVVRKVGAKTGSTEGVVISISEPFDNGDHSFVSQIVIEGINGDFSDGGDSGSVILRGNEVVGILHGKTTDEGFGVACPFLDAQDRLGIVLS